MHNTFCHLKRSATTLNQVVVCCVKVVLSFTLIVILGACSRPDAPLPEPTRPQFSYFFNGIVAEKPYNFGVIDDSRTRYKQSYSLFSVGRGDTLIYHSIGNIQPIDNLTQAAPTLSVGYINHLTTKGSVENIPSFYRFFSSNIFTFGDITTTIDTLFPPAIYIGWRQGDKFHTSIGMIQNDSAFFRVQNLEIDTIGKAGPAVILSGSLKCRLRNLIDTIAISGNFKVRIENALIK